LSRSLIADERPLVGNKPRSLISESGQRQVWPGTIASTRPFYQPCRSFYNIGRVIECGDFAAEHGHNVSFSCKSRRAACGDLLRVDGRKNGFDFTHLDDITEAVLRIVSTLIGDDRSVPVLQLVSGAQTTLGGLAELAMSWEL